jgi:SAM-dependent methyltransferase
LQTNDTIIPDQQSAAGYDQQARETHWFGPDVVFGLAWEFVKPGDSLLDLGIGSGLSSLPFYKAGLQIYGLDGSGDILDVCRNKGFAAGLKQHDLRRTPLPYASGSFDYVISVAVLNSFEDLGPLFDEVARVQRPGGVFAFTVEDRQPGQEDRYAINRVEVDEKPKEESAVMLFRHSTEIITALLARSGFIPLKTLEFLAFKYPAERRNVYFKAYVARKRGE